MADERERKVKSEIEGHRYRMGANEPGPDAENDDPNDELRLPVEQLLELAKVRAPSARWC